jgi:hypothetical protein
MQEAERIKQVENRKVQAEIDRARDQNAKRKMDKVQSREWDSGKGSGERERRRPPQKKPDNYNRPQSTSNQPAFKQSNSTKPTSSKSASTKPTSNEPSVNEPSVDQPTLDEPSSNEVIPDTGPPEILEMSEMPASENVFSPDQENDYHASPGDTTVPKEAFVDAFSPAVQEKSDYSEWFTGDTSNATQTYSTPNQSASQTGTQTGSHQSSNYRSREGGRGGERGRGRGRGRGKGEGGRGSSNTGPRRGTEKEAPKPS